MTQLGLALQDPELERVSGRIAATVTAFLRERLSTDPVFSSAELHRYVEARHPGAPASSDRILRLLRAERRVRYELVSRPASLYRVEGVA